MSSANTLEERDDHSVAASANLRAQLSFQGSGSDLFVFPVPHVHGVNIGSWFIPERWMQTSFYEGVDDYWSQLCGLVKMKGFAEAEARMQNHLAAWFTEKDFDFLYSQGITSIRIPLGYWNIIQDPYNMYVPINYLDSVKYLDWAFDQAESRGMTIMLDFHAAPGSQNGYDHSGCGYGSLNGEKWNVEQNKQLSLNAIDALAARYTKR
jgi:glucan 1,3-beta-glucosidase